MNENRRHLPPAFGGPEPGPVADYCDFCGRLIGEYERQFGVMLGEKDEDLEFSLCERCGITLWEQLVGRT